MDTDLPPGAVGPQTLPRLARAIRTFAASEVGGRAAALAVLLLVLLLGINALNVVNSYVGRDFMTAIERRDAREFVRMAVLYVSLFAVTTLVAVMFRFTEERLGLMWRSWLTRRAIESYLDTRLYCDHLVADGALPNPDQRIADDVRSFTTTTLSIALIFLNGTFTILAFSGVLWSISRPLLAVAAGYAALGSLLAIGLGRPLVRLNYEQADREAGLRAALIDVRENAEPIGLTRGEPLQAARLFRHVDAIVANVKRIVAVNRNLSFFTTGYNYLIQIVPALVVAPLFIGGSVEFGVIPQSSIAFSHVVGAFSVIVNQFPLLSSYTAILARLTALVDAAETAAGRTPSAPTVVEDDGRLAFDGVTLRTRTGGRPLVRDLSVELPAGSRLLVRGPGDATAALLRAVAGLWNAGEGRVVRPLGDGLAVVPGEPYVAPATLRGVLAGAGAAARVPDDRIRETLRALGADGLVERAGGLDVEVDRARFSPEEQAILGMARALLGAPCFVVLARMEAGVGAARAAAVLDALAGRGIGYLVLGDERLDPRLFDAVVDIAPDGAWTQTVRPGVGPLRRDPARCRT